MERTSTSVPTSPNPMASMSFPSTVQESIKPNPHPYAIRTTSTGVLSRSNSSGRNTAASRHHYVPLSSSSGKRDGKGHRAIKSASSLASFESPQPLPVPPEFSSTPGTARRTRADTLPSGPSRDDVANALELPANPKLWTVSQVSSYLRSALLSPSSSSDSGELPPLAIVQDVAAIVRQAKINGRAFLRLNEEDLENMGINQRWREALLNASRTLRQSAIKAQIWGIESDASPPKSSSLVLPSYPYSNASCNSSSSSLDLASDEGEPDKPPRRSRGRVRGMVESFERSGSFSSESSFDGNNPDDHVSSGRWLQEEVQDSIDGDVVLSPISEQPQSVPMICTDSACIALPEEPSIEALLASDADANADRTCSWGARAWEELDLAPSITVKHVSGQEVLHGRQECQDQDQDQENGTVLPRGTREGAARTTRGSGRGRSERRVVTAIFAPCTPTKGAPENPEDPVSEVDIEGLNIVNREQDAETVAEEEAVERAREAALEAELAETRALVQALKTRLEGVERELTALQELEAQRERQYVHRANTEGPGRTVDGVIVQPRRPFEDTPPQAADPKEQSVSDASATSPTSPLLQSIPQRMSSAIPDAVGEFSREEPNERHRAEQDDHNEPALSELPQYVFLVGFGVCAVVLQVVLRKFVGRHAGFGWR